MHIYQVTNTLTGHRYIGKTSRSDIYKRWKEHLSECKRYSTHFYNAINKYGSNSFIIESIENTGPLSRQQLNDREIYWIAKLNPEYNSTRGGDGGYIHDQTGKRWKIRDTSRMRGSKTVTEAVLRGRERLRGGNNYQSRYFIYTPWGAFETWRDATTKAKELYKQGRRDVVRDGNTLRSYCLEDIILSKEGRRTFPEWRGKSTKELGFYVENKSC